MNRNIEHDRFVNKNKQLAQSYLIDKKDDELQKKGFGRHGRSEEATCFNCKLKVKCSEFRKKRSGGTAGAVSYGGAEQFYCEKYIPEPSKEKQMTDRQIKSLLKNAKKGI